MSRYTADQWQGLSPGPLGLRDRARTPGQCAAPLNFTLLHKTLTVKPLMTSQSNQCTEKKGGKQVQRSEAVFFTTQEQFTEASWEQL